MEIYPVFQGRVCTRSLEVHIVDHCNLRCADCCSLSPMLPKWSIDPADLARDLTLAKKALSPKWFKIVGGEPLLHPQIDECLAVARRAGIADIVSTTTNGFLLPRMSARFWELTQALTVSLYPRPALPSETIEEINRLGAAHCIPINWKTQDHFVRMDRPLSREDDEATRAIFRECWLRRRCHILSRGRFYTCTRPAHLQTLLGDQFFEDGVLLHDRAELMPEIHSYLHREHSLRACAVCEGGHAPQSPHRQMTPEEIPASRAAWTG
jgi:cyclic pyranopterin phosphate synthase